MNKQTKIENLCKNLKRLRLLQGQSIFAFARLLHISSLTLKRLELGQLSSQITINLLFEIEEVCGVSIYSLFCTPPPNDI